ncbi:HAMP domain-containing sensor histidine kinase [Bengtsoniella intestinalis]|uniref:sensor histidine kinase n=1 Tax=Bengtsoniella intestinalis TaxID=3073143 RepID=UPI00391F9506
MIKRLRRQFIFTTMTILVLFVVVMMLLLNVLFHIMGYQQNLSLLRQLSVMPWGELPAVSEEVSAASPIAELLGEGANNSALYVAQLSGDGTLENWIVINGDGEPSADLINTIQQAISTTTDATYHQGDYLYVRNGQLDGEYVAVMDVSNSVESMMVSRLYTTSLLICLLCLVVLYPICVFLSRWVTRPTEKAFTQQKQFISDAGHELKTPLSIISINAKVLEQQVGQSKHMDYIQSEIGRMHRLISQLLTLAKMEGNPMQGVKTIFPLSDTIFQVALPFEGVAFERNITYDMDIDEEIMATGNQDQIAQVAIILLDNAFKYTGDTVKISLKKQGKHKVLEVYNNGAPIDQEELPYIFQRFYRCDKSRTSAEGYGLGLSIAKSIVDAHHGTIDAHSVDREGVCFRVVL